MGRRANLPKHTPWAGEAVSRLVRSLGGQVAVLVFMGVVSSGMIPRVLIEGNKMVPLMHRIPMSSGSVWYEKIGGIVYWVYSPGGE